MGEPCLKWAEPLVHIDEIGCLTHQAITSADAIPRHELEERKNSQLCTNAFDMLTVANGPHKSACSLYEKKSASSELSR